MKTLLLLFLSATSAFAADITGTVLLPDGKPAAAVQVVLAVSNPVNLDRAHVREVYGENRLVNAGTDGSFSFPSKDGDWVVFAVSEAGFAQVERKEFEHDPRIALQPWGRIEGVLRVGKGVGAATRIVLGSPPGARLFLELQAFQDQTDASGRFEFACVPPGTWAITHSGEPFWFGEKVTVKSGETNHVVIGGTGRPVIGKLLLPAIATNPPLQASLPPSRSYLRFKDSPTNVFTTFSASAKLHGENRELTPLFALDGTFRVDDVPAGTWCLTGTLTQSPPRGGQNWTVALTSMKFVVPEMPGGRSDEPLDLGTVEVPMIHLPEIGGAAADFNVTTTGGQSFNTTDFRGRYLLLDFEAMSYGPIRTNESAQATWDAFAKNDRFAMLTVEMPPTHSGLIVTPLKPKYSWPLTQLQGMPAHELQTLRASFGLNCDRSLQTDPELPLILLVGPDGKIVSRIPPDGDIKAAVTRALATSDGK